MKITVKKINIKIQIINFLRLKIGSFYITNSKHFGKTKNSSKGFGLAYCLI